MCDLGRRELFVAARTPELANDSVEGCGYALSATNCILLAGCVPVEIERPTLGTVPDVWHRGHTFQPAAHPYINWLMPSR